MFPDIDGVDEVSLETVEDFDGERDAVGGGAVAGCLESGDAGLPLIGGARTTGELADGGVHGAADDGGAR